MAFGTAGLVAVYIACRALGQAGEKGSYAKACELHEIVGFEAIYFCSKLAMKQKAVEITAGFCHPTPTGLMGDVPQARTAVDLANCGATSPHHTVDWPAMESHWASDQRVLTNSRHFQLLHGKEDFLHGGVCIFVYTCTILYIQRILQRHTKAYKGIQRHTKAYKGIQRHTKA